MAAKRKSTAGKGRLLYAASEADADLLYETGFQCPDPFLWLSVNGQAYMVVSVLELERARKQRRKDVTVLSVEQAAAGWGLEPDEGRSIANLIGAASLHFAKEKFSWEVSENFSYKLVREVEDAVFRMSLDRGRADFMVKFPVPAGNFCPGRQVKTAEEIQMLRHSETLAEAGLARALEILGAASIDNKGFLRWKRKALTAEILQGEINAEIARKGGTAAHTIAAPGVQAADPHQEGYGPVPANVPIVFDIFPRCDKTGYFGDLTRTVVKGKASDVVKKAFNAVYDAQRTVLDMLSPDITGVEAHAKAAEVMRNHGFSTDLRGDVPCGFIHGLGHSVGLEIHEGPNLNTRNKEKLRPGNVVTVEPGLYYPEWGGIRIEDVAAVTEDGAENLTSAPVFLEIE